VGILKQELFKQLGNDQLRDACVLIYANKQDLVRARVLSSAFGLLFYYTPGAFVDDSTKPC
jgi:hypothetical protein